MRRLLFFRRFSAGARWGRKNASAFLFAYERKYSATTLQANQTALCGCLSGRRAKRRAPDGPPDENNPNRSLVVTRDWFGFILFIENL